MLGDLLPPSLLADDPLFNVYHVVVGTNTSAPATGAAALGTTTTHINPPLASLHPQRHHDGVGPSVPVGGPLHPTVPTPTPTLTPHISISPSAPNGCFYRPSPVLQSQCNDSPQLPQVKKIFDAHRSVAGGFKAVAPSRNAFASIKETVGVKKEAFSLHWSAFIGISLPPPPPLPSSAQALPSTTGPNTNTRIIHLGNWPTRDIAARTHDITALKAFGATKAVLNFPLSDYQPIVPSLNEITLEQLVVFWRMSSTYGTPPV